MMEKIYVCRKCSSLVTDVAMRIGFCQNCGHKFFGPEESRARRVGELSFEIDLVENHVKNQTERLKKLREEREGLCAKIEVDVKEVLDWQAPNCGRPWSKVEALGIESRLKDFVYDMAKATGRSTHAIRCRILKLLASQFTRAKWLGIFDDEVK